MSTAPLPLQIETSGPNAGIAVLRLEQPGRPVIVLDQELFQALEATLKAVPRGAIGLVVASASERVFVAGADLKSISEWDDARLDAYLQFGSRVFAMIAAMPFPTVAAINGAALGGGLELAMHCDALVASPPTGKPYPVGLPEAGLGLCPGWGGTNLLPARIDPAEAIRRTATGATMPFEEAVSMGLFDRVAPAPDRLMETAMGWVRDRAGKRKPDTDAPLRWIGRSEIAAKVLAALDSVELPATGPGMAVREAVGAGLAQGWDAALKTERQYLVRLRHTPEAKTAFAAFFARSAAKPAPTPAAR